jgi:cell division protein ZapB
MNKDEKPRSSNSRTWLVIIIIGLIIANIAIVYTLLRQNASDKAMLEGMLRDQKSRSDKDLGNLSAKLQEQIALAERTGEENRSFVDSLQKVLRSIETDRLNLRNTLKVTQDQMKQYQEKIAAYEILLKKKDQEIDKLRETANLLYDKNNELKEEKNKLIVEKNEIDKDREKLRGKVDAAGVLKAENLVVNAITDKGKEISGGQYRAKNIAKINISFNIAENRIAKIGNREVFMRIVEPTGTVLANAGTSGKFEMEDGAGTYTARQQILFDNSRQIINFQYKRGGEYNAGRHTVEIYCEGQKIGVGSFDIR